MYKQVFEIISLRLFRDVNNKLPPETNPIAVLNRLEAESKSLARRGLQSGLNDCLSSLNHYPKEIVADINTELEGKNLPDIHTLSGVIGKTVKQVLKAGKIKNNDQYYIVKEILDDTISEISDDDRNKLSECFRNYEMAARR